MNGNGTSGRSDSAPVEVIAGILEQDGRYLVAKRPAQGALPNLWEFPGGKVEAGETPEQALKREFFEELGVRIDIGGAVGVILHEYPEVRVRLSGYRVYHRSGRFELRVHSEMRWLTARQIRDIPLAPADVPLARALEAATE